MSLKAIPKACFLTFFLNTFASKDPRGGLERESRLRNFKLLIIKMVIKACPAPDASRIECLWWVGFPHTLTAGLCEFPVPWSCSGSISVSAGERSSDAGKQRMGDLGSPPPRLLNHVCLVSKRDASSHTPNGADHTQSFFMFFPGAVFLGTVNSALDLDGT